jgi:membrane protein implicated in regulation of membrane protease activity
MSPSQLWLIAAIVLFILEIITPGFVLANLGVAAIGAAVAAWLGGDLLVQVITFVVLCLISFFTVRPLLQRTLRNDKTTLTGVNALAGRLVKVTEPIPGNLEAGRVQVDGDSWRALSNSSEAIEQGAVVRILRVDSTTVYVERT